MKLPPRVVTSYWPLSVPFGSWWLYAVPTPLPRRTFKRFQTNEQRAVWLKANGYELDRVIGPSWGDMEAEYVR